MKYTMTVWVDFEAESVEEATLVADYLRTTVVHRAFSPAREPVVTGFDSEWAEAEKQESTPEEAERMAHEDARWAYLDKRQLP